MTPARCACCSSTVRVRFTSWKSVILLAAVAILGCGAGAPSERTAGRLFNFNVTPYTVTVGGDREPIMKWVKVSLADDS